MKYKGRVIFWLWTHNIVVFLEAKLTLLCVDWHLTTTHSSFKSYPPLIIFMYDIVYLYIFIYLHIDNSLPFIDCVIWCWKNVYLQIYDAWLLTYWHIFLNS